MTTAFGTFIWNGELPQDDRLGVSLAGKVSEDFGEQWSHEANYIITEALYPRFLASTAFSGVGAPIADDHCWEIPFVFLGRKASIWLQWLPDGDCENAFAFDIGYRYNWFRSVFGFTGHVGELDPMRTPVSDAIASHSLISKVEWDRRP